MNKVTRKRLCTSAHCDMKTLHEVTVSDDGLPIWKCGNCGLESARRSVSPRMQ